MHTIGLSWTNYPEPAAVGYPLENLALYCRPRLFSDLIGNSIFKAKFARVLEKIGAIPPAILIAGPDGCGKTAAGMLVIRRLLCRRESDDAQLVRLDPSSPISIDPCCCCARCKRDLDSLPLRNRIVFDCGTLTRKLLSETLTRARAERPFAALLLDNAHRAADGVLDPLIPFIDAPSPNLTVVLTTSHGAPLNSALMERLVILQLSRPPADELREFLDTVWAVVDPPSALSDELLTAIIGKHNGVPSRCIDELARVHHRGIRTLDQFVASAT